MRRAHTAENLSAVGGYVLRAPEGERDVTLFATGSEVSLAVEAAERLAAEGIRAAVVSMPCFELFAAAAAAYRDSVLGTAPRVAVEAALRQGWDIVLVAGRRLHRHVGASAPARRPAIFSRAFGITAEAYRRGGPRRDSARRMETIMLGRRD